MESSNGIIADDQFDAFLVGAANVDGLEKEVDFGSFLREAKNPMARKYLDQNLFRNFKIDYGDIIWNDYEMCFPIWDLYDGKI
jgi:hypothetical protein